MTVVPISSHPSVQDNSAGQAERVRKDSSKEHTKTVAIAVQIPVELASTANGISTIYTIDRRITVGASVRAS